MSDCVNCQCEDIVVGKKACQSLLAQNDDKIKMHALVLRDSQMCEIVDQTAKFAYSQWCFNKNVSNQLCWLANNSGGGGVAPEPIKYKAGNLISISPDNVISFTGTIPNSPAPSGSYNDSELRAENERLKRALTKIINNLQNSGAWTGGLDGGFVSNRNIATGNINLFSNTVDGNSFIRTSAYDTENDLAGGIS